MEPVVMGRDAGPQVLQFADAETLARESSEFFVARAADAISKRGMFYVALSGGSTPRALFQTLSSDQFRDRVDWSRIQVFFSDERFVPASSPESNYRMATEALLSRVPVHERFVHRVATENATPEEAAALYEEGIRRVLEAGLGEIPAFDLILLGLGGDGHTASLFPGTAALDVRDLLVAANFVETMNTWRVTFTYPLINSAHCVAFLVQGEAKAERVAQVIQGTPDLPASHVHPHDGQLVWLMDRAAGKNLQNEETRTEAHVAPDPLP